MLAERLRGRCKSAVPIGTARLPDYALEFSKRSIDKSGKATLVRAVGEAVHGVIFTLSIDECDLLDQAEGVGSGYDRLDRVEVTLMPSDEPVPASSYIAAEGATDSSLVPYDWYHALVMAGAIQHRLPASYIQRLARVEFSPDTNLTRKSRLEALRVLDAAGYAHRLDHPA